MSAKKEYRYPMFNTIKRLISIFITLCIMINAVPVLQQQSIAYAFTLTPAGDGTAAYPYIITAAEQLAELAGYVNAGNAAYNDKHYRLGNDIDLAALVNDPGFNSGNGWVPIGTSTQPFKGRFDGSNFTVGHLLIHADYDGVGLFGYIGVGAEVSNLYLTRVSIDSTASYVGGIAGINAGTINNCHIIDDVIYFGSHIEGYVSVGGIVGSNTSTGVVEFSGVYNIWDNVWVGVKGTTNVGGVVGQNNGTAHGCYATGSFTVQSYSSSAGGVVGSNYGGTIDSCYSDIDVSGVNSTGGLAGAVWGGSVSNCYATGNVTGSSSLTGGVVGCILGGGTVSYVYSTGIVRGTNYVGGIVGGTTDSSQTGSTVKSTVALNAGVISDMGIYTYAGRIIGSDDNGIVTLSCNRASGSLQDRDGNSVLPVWPNRYHNQINGADAGPPYPYQAAFWTNTPDIAGWTCPMWDEDIWEIKDGVGFPTLKATQPSSSDEYTVLVLDESDSMFGLPFMAMRNIAEKIVKDTLINNPDSQIAVIVFNDTGLAKAQGFTDNQTTLINSIKNMLSTPQTNVQANAYIWLGLSSAGDLLKEVSGGNKRIILLSNGLYSSPAAAIAKADELKNDGIVIETRNFLHAIGKSRVGGSRAAMQGISSSSSDNTLYREYGQANISNPHESPTVVTYSWADEDFSWNTEAEFLADVVSVLVGTDDNGNPLSVSNITRQPAGGNIQQIGIYQTPMDLIQQPGETVAPGPLGNGLLQVSSDMPLPFSYGVVLGTGDVKDMFNEPAGKVADSANIDLTYPHLGFDTKDQIELGFDINSISGELSLDYFFASTEYNGYYTLNDVFGLWIFKSPIGIQPQTLNKNVARLNNIPTQGDGTNIVNIINTHPDPTVTGNLDWNQTPAVREYIPIGGHDSELVARSNGAYPISSGKTNNGYRFPFAGRTPELTAYAVNPVDNMPILDLDDTATVRMAIANFHDGQFPSAVFIRSVMDVQNPKLTIKTNPDISDLFLAAKGKALPSGKLISHNIPTKVDIGNTVNLEAKPKVPNAPVNPEWVFSHWTIKVDGDESIIVPLTPSNATTPGTSQVIASLIMPGDDVVVTAHYVRPKFNMLVLDVSNSVNLGSIKSTAVNNVTGLLNNDKTNVFGVVSFAQTAAFDTALNFSNDIADITKAINNPLAEGTSTNIHDGLLAADAALKAAAAPPHSNIVLFSDGLPTMPDTGIETPYPYNMYQYILWRQANAAFDAARSICNHGTGYNIIATHITGPGQKDEQNFGKGHMLDLTCGTGEAHSSSCPGAPFPTPPNTGDTSSDGSEDNIPETPDEASPEILDFSPAPPVTPMPPVPSAPVYEAAITPTRKTFPATQPGYVNAGMEQIFTIENTGTEPLTDFAASFLAASYLGSNFEISTKLEPVEDTLWPGEAAFIGIRPVDGLEEGDYIEFLNITASDGIDMVVELNFTVSDGPLYSVAVYPSHYTFPEADEGYDSTQMEKTFLIENTGTEFLTGLDVSLGSPHFKINMPMTEVTLASSGVFIIGVKPVEGLPASPEPYTDTLRIIGDNGIDLSVLLNFLVRSVSKSVEPEQPVTTPGLPYGDFNNDGMLDSSDLILMLRYFARPGVAINTIAADVNGDGRVDMSDLILFLRYFSQPGVVLGPPKEEDWETP